MLASIHSVRRSVAAIAFFVGLTGCGLIPTGTSTNKPICPDTQLECRPERHGFRNPLHPVPRARQEFQSLDEFKPETFVGLALSGGGSRAANFSLAAMQQLDELGLLSSVAAISSTSGGGLSGAYFSLHGQSTDWQKAKDVFRTNFLGNWIAHSLYPQNILRVLFSHYDRSDIMAEVLNDQLFSDATFEDLGKPGPRRPIWISNATDVTHNGLRFTFTEEDFASLTGSRLDNYQIARAVMASAAFPGAFNTMTLTSYPLFPLLPDGSRKADVPVHYTHLIDGGAADNLGVESLLILAASHQLSNPTSERNNCLIFVVDAYTVGVEDKRSYEPDPRNWFDFTVDTNFLDAFDVLLAKRRTDLLSLAGFAQSDESQTREVSGDFVGDFLTRVGNDGLRDELISPYKHVREIDVPLQIGRGALVSQAILPARGRTPPTNYFRCTTWHIGLDSLMSIKPFISDASGLRRLHRLTESQHPSLQYRARLKKLVSQIDTNFKLVGPSNCSATQLQDALFAAAHIAIREDHISRSQICEWAAAHKIETSNKCREFPQITAEISAPVELVSTAPFFGKTPFHDGVNCRVP